MDLSLIIPAFIAGVLTFFVTAEKVLYDPRSDFYFCFNGGG